MKVQIAVQELKAGLSGYLARARAGELIEVTLHRKPIVRLSAIADVAAAGIGRLQATGAAHWDGGKPALPEPVMLERGGASLAEIVAEDRG